MSWIKIPESNLEYEITPMSLYENGVYIKQFGDIHYGLCWINFEGEFLIGDKASAILKENRKAKKYIHSLLRMIK